jgi:hypothetical protein
MRTRTWLASASVLALCVVPALAQARDRGHDRRDEGRRRSSENRHDERATVRRHDERGAGSGQRQRAESRNWQRQRADSQRDSGWRGRSSERGRNTGGVRERADRDRRDDHAWRGSYRSEPRRAWPSFRARPLRYPSGYRYGYYHAHGFYFPRYYYDDHYGYPRAALRILVEPDETEVYVDGYYAGVVDDFDGLFQRLYLAPGGHEITLRLDGYQTWSAEIFAAPDSTVRLRHDMLPGPSGEFEDANDSEEPASNY